MNNDDVDLSTSLEELYLKEDYKAVEQMLMENKEQLDPGVYHYNLGTIQGKQQKLAHARFNLEMAIKKGFINNKSKNNLQVVKEQLYMSDLDASGVSWFLNLPDALYLTTSLVLSIGVLLLIRLKKTMKKIVMTACILMAWLPFLIFEFYLDKMSLVINLKDTSLREGPSTIYPELKVIEAGAKFITGEENNGWYFIESPYDLSGWVKKDDLAGL